MQQFIKQCIATVLAGILLITPVTAGVMSGEAPDFTLKGPEGKRAATLSSFTGNKPVALIFGSYT